MPNETNLSERKEKYQGEQVYVVPHTLLTEIPNKFTREKHTKDIWSRYDTVGRYIYRYDAEGNSSFQQIIPYIIIYNPEDKKFFTSYRMAKTSEDRLVGQRSIGFGGHINPEDGTRENLFKALYRELHEELFIEPLEAAEFIGYVRDMGSKTSDHFGCAFLIKATEVSVKETDKLDGSWSSMRDLEKGYFDFENWSRLIIDYLVMHEGKF